MSEQTVTCSSWVMTSDCSFSVTYSTGKYPANINPYWYDFLYSNVSQCSLARHRFMTQVPKPDLNVRMANLPTKACKEGVKFFTWVDSATASRFLLAMMAVFTSGERNSFKRSKYAPRPAIPFCISNNPPDRELAIQESRIRTQTFP